MHTGHQATISRNRYHAIQCQTNRPTSWYARSCQILIYECGESTHTHLVSLRSTASTTVGPYSSVPGGMDWCHKASYVENGIHAGGIRNSKQHQRLLQSTNQHTGGNRKKFLSTARYPAAYFHPNIPKLIPPQNSYANAHAKEPPHRTSTCKDNPSVLPHTLPTATTPPLPPPPQPEGTPTLHSQ